MEENIAGVVSVLLTQESTTYKIPDYLSSTSARAQVDDPNGNGTQRDRSVINELWREKICQWCYQVVDHFDLDREVVSVALNYIDRFVATRTVNRRIFQLATMTALWIAIKLFEPGNNLRMSQLTNLSSGYFMAEHVVAMEKSMLQSLKWHVNPPTPFTFCRELMRLVSSEITPRVRHDVNELARFLAELSVCDYWFVTRKRSSIALAAIVNSLELQGVAKVKPCLKIEFLNCVVKLGIDIASDEETIECYERLREMYIIGGYTPTLEDGKPKVDDAAPKSEEEARVDTVSPTGVRDGPDGRNDASNRSAAEPSDDGSTSDMSL